MNLKMFKEGTLVQQPTGYKSFMLAPVNHTFT